MDMHDSYPVSLEWGNANNTFQGPKHKSNNDAVELDLTSRLPKTSLKRKLNDKQLLTGHMRLDLLNPLTKGNLVLVKGKRSVGKTELTKNVIQTFLKTDPNAKAIYVSMQHVNQKNDKNFIDDMEPDMKNRVMVIGVDSEGMASSYLAPQVALKVALKEKNVLLVFDDVLLQQNRESALFDLADQPFSPNNIVNAIAEKTGSFEDR